jgi:hypothetical protein
MDKNATGWVGTRVSLRLSAGTALLELFNPPHGFMDEAMQTELGEALDHLDAWAQGRAVIVTGRDAGTELRPQVPSGHCEVQRV